MIKEQEYKQFVSDRKKCRLCAAYGMTNQSETNHDTNSIGKWSDWQGNLNARIMVIGQDWGSIQYWNNNKGKDSPTNPTNLHLVELINTLGFQIGTNHNQTTSQPLFFSNAVLCLKYGTMSANLTQKCIQNCGTRFLKPLIELIKPEIIITLGYRAYASLLTLYKPIGIEKTLPLKAVVRREPIVLNVEGLKFFPMYHCGGLGLANRSLSEQKNDWENIKGWL